MLLFFVSFFTLAPDLRGFALRKETKNRAESLPRGGFFRFSANETQ
ncbi:pheST operon leader peptide PheM [Erwinia amylovora]|nr:pheST operon leader peptide PheM [Erwinia amylovora]